MTNKLWSIKERFRGFQPFVVDVETSGFDAKTHAILEIAVIPIDIDVKSGRCVKKTSLHFHVAPFDGSTLDPKALEFTGIDPGHPFRYAEEEYVVFSAINGTVNTLLQANGCTKGLLVAHNAHFDQGFINAAYERTGLKNPFHAFTALDTATLSALAFGETVLAKALYKARIPFDPNEAHSALYDTEKTATLFCKIMNAYTQLI